MKTETLTAIQTVETTYDVPVLPSLERLVRRFETAKTYRQKLYWAVVYLHHKQQNGELIEQERAKLGQMKHSHNIEHLVIVAKLRKWLNDQILTQDQYRDDYLISPETKGRDDAESIAYSALLWTSETEPITRELLRNLRPLLDNSGPTKPVKGRKRVGKNTFEVANKKPSKIDNSTMSACKQREKSLKSIYAKMQPLSRLFGDWGFRGVDAGLRNAVSAVHSLKRDLLVLGLDEVEVLKETRLIRRQGSYTESNIALGPRELAGHITDRVGQQIPVYSWPVGEIRAKSYNRSSTLEIHKGMQYYHCMLPNVQGLHSEGGLNVCLETMQDRLRYCEEQAARKKEVIDTYRQKLQSIDCVKLGDSRDAKNCISGTMQFLEAFGINIPEELLECREWSDVELYALPSEVILARWEDLGCPDNPLFLKCIDCAFSRHEREMTERFVGPMPIEKELQTC